jgi:hypothetical protein
LNLVTHNAYKTNRAFTQSTIESYKNEAASDAVVSICEPFEPETTARNLNIIRGACERRRESPLAWTKQIEEPLDSAVATMMSKFHR